MDTRVAIVGAGPWPTAVCERVALAFPGAALADLRDGVDRVIAGHDLVVAVGADRGALNRAALASARGNVLFVESIDGAVVIGPVVARGQRPCASCVGLDGGAEAPEDLVRELALAALVEEVAHVLRAGRPRAPATVTVIDRRGVRERRSAAPDAACDACARAPRRGAAGFEWVDPPRASELASPSVPWVEGDVGARILAALQFLDELGASTVAHAVTTFRDHLLGTWRILTAWGQPEAVCLAGLFHSVYGSDRFDVPLVRPASRPEVAARIGADAERLAWMFCTVDRRALYAELTTLRGPPGRGMPVTNWRTGERAVLAPADVSSLVAMDAANVAEQAHAGDLSPGIWLAKWSRRVAVVGLCGTPFAASTTLDEADERAAVEGYVAALSGRHSPSEAERLLVSAARRCSLIGEPLIAAAWFAAARRDVDVASERAAAGLARARRWATAWDKRACWERWLGFAEQLVPGGGDEE